MQRLKEKDKSWEDATDVSRSGDLSPEPIVDLGE